MNRTTSCLAIAASLCVSTTACRDDVPGIDPPGPLGETDSDASTPPQPDTDGDTDDIGVDPAKVCKTSPGDDTPGDTVRWLCDGTAIAKRDIDVDEGPMIQALKNAVPGNLGDDEIEKFVNNIEFMINLDVHQFGPNYNDNAAEALTVIACCEDDYDYPNTAPPDSPGAEHGLACAVDCVDQMCRSVGFYLKDLGDQTVSFDIPGVPDILEPFKFQEDLRDDFYALANFYNEHGFLSCIDVFEEEDVAIGLRTMKGTFDIDEFLADARAACDDDDAECLLPGLKILRTEWLLNLDYEGTCSVGFANEENPNHPGWHPTDDPCDSISDNDSFGFPWNQGARGGGWLGSDDFTLVEGQVSVQGPEILGLDISGSSTLQSSAMGCEADGRCAKLSIRFDRGDALLRELDLPLPSALNFTIGDVRAEILEGRLLLNESLLLPIENDTITIPAGALSMVVSAQVVVDASWNYSLLETATNADEIKILVAWDGEDSYSLNIPTWTLEHEDVYGTTWTATIDTHEWFPTERSPKARVRITDGVLSASESSDPEEGTLSKTWSVDDGSKTSEPPPLSCTAQSVQLCVEDSTGKQDCKVHSAKPSSCE